MFLNNVKILTRVLSSASGGPAGAHARGAQGHDGRAAGGPRAESHTNFAKIPNVPAFAKFKQHIVKLFAMFAQAQEGLLREYFAFGVMHGCFSRLETLDCSSRT